MARQQEEAENHWPGFVDALSTIVMVVTFLLIILGVVIFVLSMQISQTLEDAKAKGQKSGQEVSQTTIVGAEGKKGTFKEQVGTATRAYKEVKSETQLAVRSQQVKESKVIEVAGDETEPKKAEAHQVVVKTAQDILTLVFPPKLLKLGKKSQADISEFMKNNPDVPEGSKLEIWSFARSDVGSISEARRIAYYRAMDTRNGLLSVGIKPENISVRVRETDDSEMEHKVKVFVKPQS